MRVVKVCSTGAMMFEWTGPLVEVHAEKSEAELPSFFPAYWLMAETLISTRSGIGVSADAEKATRLLFVKV